MLQIPETAESFSDISDQASHYEHMHNAGSLQAVRARLAPQTHPDFDGVHCLDCGVKLPKQRLADGRIYCTTCQEIIDKKNKLRRA